MTSEISMDISVFLNMTLEFHMVILHFLMKRKDVGKFHGRFVCSFETGHYLIHSMNTLP